MKIFQLVAAMYLTNDAAPLVQIDSFVVKASSMEEAAEGILPMVKAKPWLSLDTLYGMEIHSNILAHPGMELVSVQKREEWCAWVKRAGLTLLWSNSPLAHKGSQNETCL